MAVTKSFAFAVPGSNSTVAVLVARFTWARVTPGVWDRVRSMVRAQAAHVMPETGRSTRSGAARFISRGHRHVVPQLPHGVGNRLRLHQGDVVLNRCAGFIQLDGYLRHAWR